MMHTKTTMKARKEKSNSAMDKWLLQFSLLCSDKYSDERSDKCSEKFSLLSQS
jgi:hypothetical protein